MSSSDEDAGALSREEIARSFDVLPERQAKIASLFNLDHEMHGYSKSGDEVYCVCRTNDTSRFMICCDQCNEWYHGECIDITEKQASKIKVYFCDYCRSRDPALEIAYKQKKDATKKGYKKYYCDDDYAADTHSGPGRKKTGGTRSSRRCGECAACHRTEDCGRCDFCKDMRKFGGPNKMRQKCRSRQCINFGVVIRQGAPYSASSRGRKLSDSSDDEYTDAQILREIRKHDLQSKKSPSKPKHTGSRKSKERKKEKSFSRSRSGRKGNDDRRAKDLGPIQCNGPGCVFAARTGSKYCTDDCGIRLAMNRMYEILPQRIQQWNSTPCAAEENNRQKLEGIRQQQLKAKESLAQLDKRVQTLEELIQKVKLLPLAPEQDTMDSEDEADLSIYCVTCGLEIGTRNALRHMEKCFNKYESQTSFGSAFMTRIEGNNMFCDVYNAQQHTYCKRLRVLCPEHCKDPKIVDDEVCGCPVMTDLFKESGEHCRIAKRKCMKHYCWEKLRRAEIDMERVRQWLWLDELFEQERTIRMAMANRAGVLGLMLHSTVNHEPPPSLMMNDQDRTG